MNRRSFIRNIGKGVIALLALGQVEKEKNALEKNQVIKEFVVTTNVPISLYQSYVFDIYKKSNERL